ncbi:SurA N-terminal domain-containing protein [Pseudaquabacterium pictum]|uniref:Periplasmic chaperone PpiD n=1 Tax=Pseudaquabacterium pictum TaxID=2315236 RepID=A0A480APG9_9BURK|nr:SurA N-terminal domain-containing protein [Rubrivivax pictus]GCL63351.1 peptidylprolyl isomerase [Rubrivivax pictus]
MFDFVRKHNRLFLGLILILILPSFVVFGIQGYSGMTEGANAAVAHVNGQKITQAEWDASHQEQAQRVRQQRPEIDPKLLDSPEARAQTLDALVRERVLAVASDKLHIAVSNERLQRLFVTDPQFAMLRNADNSINKDLISAQGMSVAAFEQRLRQDLTLQQVQGGITGSVLAAAAPVNQALDALLQRREIRFTRFNAPDYLAKVAPTDADIEAYYKQNEASFRAPEQASIEYVVLDLAVLKKTVAVPEEDLRKYYTENASRYTAAEERRARHILVQAAKDAPADVKQKAKAKADGLLAEARKNPAGFAELAKKNSDDPGSAPNGGDLDFFGRGAMVKPFEDAAFAMKPGEISNVVESDFGYHIIQLEAVRGGEKKPFEAVRAAIEEEVRQQGATQKWAEAAEQFTNTVYEQADSLQPVIDKLKLEKKTATVRRQPLPGASGPLVSAKLLDAVFGNDAIKNKRNTDAVETGPNQLTSARVLQHQPARTLPLAEVRDQVRQRLVASQAEALARKDGEARLAQLKADPANAATAGSLTGPAVVSRAQPGDLSRTALEAVLAADATKLPAVVGVALPGEGYLVARIDKLMPRDIQPEENTALKGQYAQAWARAEAEAYYRALSTRYKVSKQVDPVAAAAAASAPKP